jgi:hypothetical protein
MPLLEKRHAVHSVGIHHEVPVAADGQHGTRACLEGQVGVGNVVASPRVPARQPIDPPAA